MKFPNWTDPQFLDANGVGGLNKAMQTIGDSIANTGFGAWANPGLIGPDTATFTPSLMIVSSTLPSTFGIISSGGAIVHAHGTQTGADTDSYNTDFAPFVPVSGSLTAYLAATITQIQQDPFAIPGPPPGFPSYNPDYVPSIGYATNVQSISLSAVTGGIDNINTFELLRTTLTAGQTGIASLSARGQFRAPLRVALPSLVLPAGGLLSPSFANQMISPAVGGLTFTMPLTTETSGLTFTINNLTTGNLTVVTSGGDVIDGYGMPSANSINLAPAGVVSLWSDGIGIWLATSAGGTTTENTNPGFTVYPGGLIRQFGTIVIAGNSQESINYATPFLGSGAFSCTCISLGTAIIQTWPGVMNISGAGSSNNNFIISNPNPGTVTYSWTIDGY